MNMLRVVSLLMLPVLFPLTVLNAEVVHLRDGAAPVDAVRVAFVPGGLEAVTSGGETRRFALDQVARIDDMTDPILIDQWRLRQDLARDVWRARSRVQRGDPELALALFQRHFTPRTSDERTHEFALIIAEGLLRCLLESGETEAILPAALETTRLRRAGVTTDRYDSLPPVIDERFWLLPKLPPIATSASSLDRLPDELRHWQIDSDPVVSRLAELYASMARRSVRSSGSPDLGVALMESILGTRSVDNRVRQDALRTLDELSALDDAPEFIAVWRAWFDATSRLAAGEVGTDPVVLSLLELPAVFQGSYPVLARRAVELAARVLSADGRDEESATLRRFLQESPRQTSPVLTPRLLPLNESRGAASNSTPDLETENE